MGEPWQGDQEEQPQQNNPFIHVGIGGFQTKEPSQEEKDKAAAESAANKAIGDLSYPSLLVYDEERLCPKCMSSRKSIRFCPGVDHSWCEKEAGNHEHIHVRCKRCRYFRTEKTLDADSQ